MNTKTLKNKLTDYGLSPKDAECVDNACEILDKIKKELQIDNESKYLATKADVEKVKTKVESVRADMKGEMNKSCIAMVSISIALAALSTTIIVYFITHIGQKIL